MVMNLASISRRGRRRSGREPAHIVGAGNVARPSGRESHYRKIVRPMRPPESSQIDAGTQNAAAARRLVARHQIPLSQTLCCHDVHRSHAGFAVKLGMNCPNVDRRQVNRSMTWSGSAAMIGDRSPATWAGTIVEDRNTGWSGPVTSPRSQDRKQTRGSRRSSRAQFGETRARHRNSDVQRAMPASISGRSILTQINTG